jgi:hypothetical protein
MNLNDLAVEGGCQVFLCLFHSVEIDKLHCIEALQNLGLRELLGVYTFNYREDI